MGEKTFPCPKCKGGQIKKHYITKDKRAYRWTCDCCERDFGYDTPEPIID